MQPNLFDNAPGGDKTAAVEIKGGKVKAVYEFNPDGLSVKGCSYIYAPRGQAGEYARLTANPYRGCGHKCAYCLDGSTLILMANGTSKPIRDIKVGDEIFGIYVDGNNRAWNTKITKTTVTAKLATKKQAIRITLEDATQVICSADHRWLTERGWKYTSDSQDGQRPHLTVNNSIRKICNSAETLVESGEYKRGYLAGMIRGDANLAIYDYSDRKRPSGKTAGIQYRFRLALKDKAALLRTKRYLSDFGVDTTEFVFNDGNNRNLSAIGTTSPEKHRTINMLIKFVEDMEWWRGWLAGIFDAEGSHGKGVIRITNTDEEILYTTELALTLYGFDFIREVNKNHASAIRIRGGRQETLRFWQIVSPSISRKLSIEEGAVCESARIVKIEPLDEIREMFDITTGTENFIANGLVSHNCYVPDVLKMSREEFDNGAVPRPDFMKHLINDARKYQLMGSTEQVMLSFTTDPFNPFDPSLTRPTLQAIKDHGMAICTLTKGGSRALPYLDMFRPDRDAFASTLTSLDDKFSKLWERGAALPQDRMDTLKKFHDAGIFTWVSCEPVLDVEATLKIIEFTHPFVDFYKIGRVNYIGLTKETDWETFTHRVIDLVQRLQIKHYIKRDLQPYLPAGYPNDKNVIQHN